MPNSTSRPIDPAIAAAALRQAVSIVDLAAIGSNFRTLAAASAPAECAAIVKGDGYGLGMLPVARAAWQAGARLFFVARVEDGVELRQEFPEARIAVLDGLANHKPNDFVRGRLIPVIGSAGDLQSWLAVKAPSPFMLHVDTAMNRLGLKPQELAGLASLLRGSPHPVAAYLTHFASADDGDRVLCRLQVERFRAALASLRSAPLSIANSSGLYLDPAWRADITRPGKALYGINPAQPGEPTPVQQALTVLAPILQIKDIAPGDTVGYSATFRATRPMRIATLGIGYANGYLRSLSNTGVVAFEGTRAPLVGRVSMDLVTVDVTDVPSAALSGGYAEALGPTIGLTELSALAGSNEYELQIALGRGCQRIYINEGAHDAAPV